MQGNWKDKYLIPAIYSVPWAIGLLNSIFCFMPSDDEAVRKITAAFAVYVVFFLNTLIDIFLFYVKAIKTHVAPMFAGVLFVIFFLLLISVLFAGGYHNSENNGMILGVFFTMLVSFYFMAVVKRNPDLCFTSTPIQKRVIKSNLR